MLSIVNQSVVKYDLLELQRHKDNHRKRKKTTDGERKGNACERLPRAINQRNRKQITENEEGIRTDETKHHSRSSQSNIS